ncbi:MAG: MerR family transcriptional regulator [Acidimicrobiales bacterium]
MSTETAIDIGDVVARSGIPPSTLHLWERDGLISPVSRRGLRRQYHPDVLQTIAVIVVCQRSGFTLAEIGELLDPETFNDGKQILVDKLEQLRGRQRELAMAIDGLEHALACSYPSPIECPGFHDKIADVLPVTRR